MSLSAPVPVYAGFGRRLGASLLDFGVRFVLLMPTTLGLIYGSRPVAMVSRFAAQWFAQIFDVYCLAKWGRSPGKWLAGIKVRRLDLGSISWREAILRESLSIVFAAVGLFIGLVAILQVSDAEYLAMPWKERFTLETKLFPIFSKYFGYLATGWGWSELIVLLLNEKKRALHDYIAGTVVVVEKSGE